MQGSALEALPYELKKHILAHCPDLKTLQCFSSVNRSFQKILHENYSVIIRHVAVTELGPVLSRHAFAAAESAAIKPKEWTNESTCTFLEEYFGRPVKYPFPSGRCFKLSSIIQTWEDVKFFTSTFLDWALANAKIDTHTSWIAKENVAATPAPSNPEILRVRETLYRFQIFCNAFRHDSDSKPMFDTAARTDIFMLELEAWEIEQFGCVVDYLHEKIWPLLLSLEQYGRSWGEFLGDKGYFLRSQFVPGIMAEGLTFIRGFITDGKPLREAGVPWHILKSQRNTFRDVLEDAGCQGFDEYYDESIVHVAKIRDGTEELYCDDYQDFGPQAAWAWGCTFVKARNGCIYVHMQWPLRQWAYVFWDSQRLHQWQIFKEECGEVSDWGEWHDRFDAEVHLNLVDAWRRQYDTDIEENCFPRPVPTKYHALQLPDEVVQRWSSKAPGASKK